MAHRYVLALVAALAAALLVRSTQAGEPGWPSSLTIVTASPGGTYHVYGEGLARMLMRVLGIPVAERTTQGPQENIELIESGQAQLGFVTMGVALQAWNGTGDWTHGRQMREFRALFPMYVTPFEFVASPESKIHALGDLAGRRIGVGPEGGTAGAYVPRILATLGIEATPVYGTWDDLAQQFEAGHLDALGAAVGVPFPALAALDGRQLIRPIALSDDEILKLRLAMPELSPSEIPPGSYPTLMRPYRTVGLYNFAVADKDLPGDLAYRIVETVFSRQQELIAVHPAAAATIPANFVYNTFLPYHPGALRYYENVSAAGIVRTD